MQNKIVSYCKPKKIQLVSLGCSKNTVDSEHLLRQVENMGIEIVPSNYELSESSKVDAVVINTSDMTIEEVIDRITEIIREEK
jgi:tRNA A37 methylthiotransferase MiaB